MSEFNEGFQNPPTIETLPENMKLKPASDPLRILEGEYASGNHLEVVDLANCLGVGLKDDVRQFAVASHIGPFGGERYDAVEQIDAWADGYVDQLTQQFGGEQHPSSIIIRSRQIGSRSLFHGRMMAALKRKFPDAQIDTRNGTDFEITF